MQRKLNWIALKIRRLTSFFQDYDSWWPKKIESGTPKKTLFFEANYFKTGGDNSHRFQIKNKVIFLNLLLPRKPIGHAICETKLRDYNLTRKCAIAHIVPIPLIYDFELIVHQWVRG